MYIIIWSLFPFTIQSKCKQEYLIEDEENLCIFRRYGTNFFLKFQCRYVRDQVVLFPVGVFHDRKQDVDEY